jgi:hypothetical protein
MAYAINKKSTLLGSHIEIVVNNIFDNSYKHYRIFNRKTDKFTDIAISHEAGEEHIEQLLNQAIKSIS